MPLEVLKGCCARPLLPHLPPTMLPYGSWPAGTGTKQAGETPIYTHGILKGPIHIGLRPPHSPAGQGASSPEGPGSQWDTVLPASSEILKGPYSGFSSFLPVCEQSCWLA